MKPQTSFKENLHRNILRFGLGLITLAIVSFAGLLLLYNYSINQHRADLFATRLDHLFSTTYHNYVNYMYALNNSEEFRGIFDGTLKAEDVLFQFTQTFKEYEIGADLLFLDTQLNPLISTLDEDALNHHLLSFLNIMIERANAYEVDTAVYNAGERYTQYIMSYPIMQNGTIGGYLFLLMDGSDWNYAISSDQVDGVMIDRFGNVIACSKRNFIEKYNRFSPLLSNTYYNNEKKYHVKTKYLIPYDLTIYVFSDASNYPFMFIIGFLTIAFLGMILLIFARKFSSQIAVNNTVAINRLIQEIDCIKQDIHHHIQFSGEEEFESIAQSINSMVDEINGLMIKNNELADMRARTEIRQLEAQFNPHFLYNTLDTIRYSIYLDPHIAGDMIYQLTSLLRYSIHRDADLVNFKEDMEYTATFLKIMKYRFNDNFSYEMQIEPACMNVLVPKLVLQPIIENSIKYGFMSNKQLHIQIKGHVLNQHLYLSVMDNGSGMEQEEVKKLNQRLLHEANQSEHLGLFNIARRLYLSFGSQSSIYLESEKNKYTCVHLMIEIKEANHDQSIDM